MTFLKKLQGTLTRLGEIAGIWAPPEDKRDDPKKPQPGMPVRPVDGHGDGDFGGA